MLQHFRLTVSLLVLTHSFSLICFLSKKEILSGTRIEEQPGFRVGWKTWDISRNILVSLPKCGAVGDQKNELVICNFYAAEKTASSSLSASINPSRFHSYP